MTAGHQVDSTNCLWRCDVGHIVRNKAACCFGKLPRIKAYVCACAAFVLHHRFQPPERFAPFLLGPGLCYNNALENAASAMEVAAVAAKNCALLVQQHAQQRQRQRHSHVPSEQAAGPQQVSQE